MPQRVIHTFSARRALLRYLAPRYQQASPVQKTLLLDAFVEETGYSRKYAIELLNHGEQDQQTIQRHRLPQYGQAVQQALFLAWKATHYVCAKRFLPSLPSLVALLERHGHLRLTEEERRQLLAMSVSTAERSLRTQRKPRLHGLSTTTPGPWRKAQIPVRTFSPWEETRPGFVEMDLVAHCGDHLDGPFLSTLTLTDLATGWTECLPLLTKSAEAVLAALVEARTLFPFPLLGIDTDSGAEFLNAELVAYCEQERLTFTRGRSGVKNDQAHVEQKNGAVVRATAGCARLEGGQAYAQLREVYQALRLVVNYVQPSLKLQTKISQGDRVRRVYDTAQTPLQRVLASGALPEERQRVFRERVQQIDPLALSEQLDALRYALWCRAYLSPVGEASGPPRGFSLETGLSFLLPVPEGTGDQKEPSSQKLLLAPDCAVSVPLEAHLPDPGSTRRSAGEEPWPQERIYKDHSDLLPTESLSSEYVASEVGQSVAQAPSLPVPDSGGPSKAAEEHETGSLALSTVEQAIAAYVQEMCAIGRDPQTLQWHQISLSALRRYLWRQLQITDIGQLSRACLQSWVSDLPIALSARTGARRTVSTVAAYARSARAFCNWLVRQGYVSEPLFPKGAVPVASRGVPQPVEPEAFVHLLHACQLAGSPGGPNAGMTARNRAILWLLRDTGLSVSELCRLCLADVDRAGGTVTVCGKKGNVRMLPLSADGKRAVCAYLDQARLTPAWEPAVPEARDRLFLTERRRLLTKNSLALLLTRLSQRAGFARAPVCPSMLRETYAIRFLQEGGALATLQEHLGVASLASVRRYQRFCEGQRKEEPGAPASSGQAMPPRSSARRSQSKQREARRRG